MPRTQKYAVDLSADERAELNAMLSSGTYKTRVLTRVRCLLHADDGLTDKQVSEAVGCHPGTVGRHRKRYTEDGLAAINRRKADRIYETKLDGREEAHLHASLVNPSSNIIPKIMPVSICIGESAAEALVLSRSSDTQLSQTVISGCSQSKSALFS
jgi:DNA-binding transcriptional ArsR family regulator